MKTTKRGNVEITNKPKVLDTGVMVTTEFYFGADIDDALGKHDWSKLSESGFDLDSTISNREMIRSNVRPHRIVERIEQQPVLAIDDGEVISKEERDHKGGYNHLVEGYYNSERIKRKAKERSFRRIEAINIESMLRSATGPEADVVNRILGPIR